MKKKITLLLTVMIVLTLLVACTSTPNVEGTTIILSTTTSTQDSGLLDSILPVFTQDTGVEVKTIAVGTGKALQMGRDGEADVLLVHAKSDELIFVEEGHGTDRHDVMYNDFILVGPNSDPLALKGKFPSDILEGLKSIESEKAVFLSRGDDSGTHKKELSIWKSANIEPAGDWYLSAGSGMADVLKIADEKLGYTITDRATYLSMRDKLDLDIIIEGDDNLFNQYGVILVDPRKSANINKDGAVAFMKWLLSDKGQDLIGEYGVEEYGQALFIPNGK